MSVSRVVISATSDATGSEYMTSVSTNGRTRRIAIPGKSKVTDPLSTVASCSCWPWQRAIGTISSAKLRRASEVVLAEVTVVGN